ncbi:MAG: hypothetical protein ABFD92_10350 [Planctomycetaceae bacterium]|nr:hypothetical protein [Planctomycetaceae bacterium]
MKRRLGFFDVDCRELTDAGDGLQFRPRVKPLAPRLEQIYGLARRLEAPLVFTTCCSGRMLDAGSLNDVLLVPLDAADQQWRRRLDSAALICLAKKTYNDPPKNYACRAFDMFADNANAVAMVRALDVGEWVVFGNGFDLCVNAAVRGLLAAGQNVRVVTDVTIASAKGYGRCGTDEYRREILADFAAAGVRLCTLDDLLAEMS